VTGGDAGVGIASMTTASCAWNGFSMISGGLLGLEPGETALIEVLDGLDIEGFVGLVTDGLIKVLVVETGGLIEAVEGLEAVELEAVGSMTVGLTTVGLTTVGLEAIGTGGLDDGLDDDVFFANTWAGA
jgi:hypothetical protein